MSGKKARRSKRHHYVPKGLQNHFCGADNKIWYAERSADGFSALEERTPNGCFWEKNLNTTIGKNGLSENVEEEWRDLDNELAPFLAHANEVLSNGSPPDLTEESVEKLRFFFAMLMTRSPELVPSVERIKQVYVSEVMGLATKLDILAPDLRARTADPAFQAQAARHIRAEALGRVPEYSLEELRKFHPTWVIAEKKSAFILGSRMVYATGNGGPNGLLNPDTELWFPISQKHVLVLSRDQSKSDKVFYLSGSRVRQWNRYILRTSERAVASHSERLLRSLLNPR